jgi:flagellar hook-basal body complex protein FliE
MPIEAAAGLASVGSLSPLTPGRGAGVSGPDSFGESLSKLLGDVEQTSTDANQAVGNMLDQSGDVHDAMIALQRAEMTLELTVQIRNKLVQAYQDIMRMPV